MSSRQLCRAAVLAAAGLLGAVAPVSAWSGGGGVSASADRSSVQPGDPLTVTGAGWPAGSPVQVSVCGNNALAGSADCDLPRAVTVATSRDGTFETHLTAGVPIKPCPCVVFVTSPDTRDVVRFPLEVTGVSSAAPRGPALGQTALEVVRVQVEGSGPWLSWFGGRPERRLVLEIRNVAEIPITPALSVLWGADRPTHPVEVDPLDELAPGESTVVEVPVTLDWLPWGSYRIGGEAVGAGTVATFESSTTAIPWGAVTVGSVLLALLAARALRRLRSRRRPGSSSPEGAAPAPPALPTEREVIRDLPTPSPIEEPVDLVAASKVLLGAEHRRQALEEASESLLRAGAEATALLERAAAEAAARRTAAAIELVEAECERQRATREAAQIRDDAAIRTSLALAEARACTEEMLERAEMEALVVVEDATLAATRITDQAVREAAQLLTAARQVASESERGPDVVDLRATNGAERTPEELTLPLFELS